MLSYGFYNSKGGDRKYDAEQFGAMFNGLITDGVFAHYKDALKVTAGSGNRELVINPGRAWFNGTWTEVDDNGHRFYLMGSAVETTYFVYLAVNKSDRKNTIAWYSSIANNDPEKGLYFYLLAQVTIPGGYTKISDSMITDTRGSDLCPYVTGIMETVSFEEIVRRVCGDSWRDWLGVYEAGITTGVQNAVATSKRALDEVESVKAYTIESEATSYIWAKFEAVPTGGGGFEWATDSVHEELADPPIPACLFRDLSYADLGPGFKPNIALNIPYIVDGESTVKPIPAVTQSKVWKEYPYFWEGGAAVGTEVLRYDDLQRVIVNVGGTVYEKYRYRISRLMHVPVTYEPGAYIGTVTADNATAYPRDGHKDGYYYMRFAATAEDVSFNCPDLSAKNVRDAIVEIARMGGNGSGTAMSVIEVEELPSTGIKGVFYIVKKPGDDDASEYLWLDRWERVGGTGSAHIQSYIASDEPPEDVGALWVDTSGQGEAVALGATVVETEEGVEIHATDELGTTRATVRHGKDGAPGKTPAKGVDYLTPDDVQEIAEQAAGMVEVPGGGGGEFSMPLLYDLTTTEEVRWIDTGASAFDAKNVLLIEMTTKASATNSQDNLLSGSIHTAGVTALAPWANIVVCSGTQVLAKQHDKVIRCIGIRGDEGPWSFVHTSRNLVNGNPTAASMQTIVPSDPALMAPITGIIIGDGSAAAGDRVLGIGTTIRIWGR